MRDHSSAAIVLQMNFCGDLLPAKAISADLEAVGRLVELLGPLAP